MTSVLSFKRPPKAVRTQMETMIVTTDLVNTWRIPPFQRPLRVNEKVREVAEGLKLAGGIIPGVVTLGVIERGKQAGTYLMDGQHRVEAFRLSELSEGIADVRICHFDDLGEMGEAFVDTNSHLVTMRPDDVLRGLEGVVSALQILREGCDFVGYDNIRRGTTSPILSVGAALRCWVGSAAETPVLGGNAARLARDMSEESARLLVDFLNMAKEAWGRDPEYGRLWIGLNLTVCMWLYRRLVLDKERGVKRFVVLTPAQFKRCMMSMSADNSYLDWLVGRHMSERDRTPCYQRIKAIFSKRLTEDTGRKPMLPQPAWAGTRSGI